MQALRRAHVVTVWGALAIGLSLTACSGDSEGSNGIDSRYQDTAVDDVDEWEVPDEPPLAPPDDWADLGPGDDVPVPEPDGCAYEGDPACGYVVDVPVPGVCTPDYPGDVACQSNEDLLGDMAELNGSRIENYSGW